MTKTSEEVTIDHALLKLIAMKPFRLLKAVKVLFTELLIPLALFLT